ncbi:MAG: hypothetical protein ACFFDN_47935 [Candidatus Hodarchaeota archaeon]
MRYKKFNNGFDFIGKCAIKMDITVNFFEILLSKNQVTVPYLNFENKEKLKDLRKNNPESIFVHSREKIYFWGRNSFAAESVEKISKNEYGKLFSKILAECFLNQFYHNKTDLKIFKKYHIYNIIFLDQEVSNNKFKGLKLYEKFQLHFAPFQIGSDIRLGFTISRSISEKISWKIQDFKTAGIQYDDLLYNKETGDVFINSKSKYRLAHFFNYASQLKNELDMQNAIQNEFEEINNFVEKYFSNYRNNFILPDEAKIISINKTNFNLDKQEGNFKNKILQKPECFFYKGKYYTGCNTNRPKIKYNKPFSYDEFENKDINISIIYPKAKYTSIANFFKNVQNELIDTFSLRKDSFKYSKYEINDFSIESYIEILPKVKDADLVIVLVDENQKILKPNQSPYYFCKAKFIERGINTQEVQIQKIEKFLSDKKNEKQKYKIHNIALNIYAKLGGMAWTIKPNEPKNELIFGIGATTNKEGKPILGLISVFRGDGKYLFGKASSVTDMKNYEANLEEVISKSIEDNIKQEILNNRDKFYLIFHIFKPAGKDNEIKALKKVLHKFSNYDFEYVFVHIGEGHNYRFFTYDYINNRPKFSLNKNGWGQNIRGTFIKIHDLLGFLGLRINSSIFHKIEIHDSSTYKDLEYIANQIYLFADMSHRSYHKSSRPVTMKYPTLMAYFAEKLKEIDGFRLNKIEMDDNSLWFI